MSEQSEPTQEPAAPSWRVGRSFPVHVYAEGFDQDRPVATFHVQADAQRAVAAVNADATALAAEMTRLQVKVSNLRTLLEERTAALDRTQVALVTARDGHRKEMRRAQERLDQEVAAHQGTANTLASVHLELEAAKALVEQLRGMNESLDRQRLQAETDAEFLQAVSKYVGGLLAGKVPSRCGNVSHYPEEVTCELHAGHDGPHRNYSNGGSEWSATTIGREW